ncbi:MAG: DnaJ domain-containing protein [Alphaproteobacteria bacterium]|jgi:curved DNA-binding protein CbpA|nr:DnaJ domain-containing protein [Alphaproteobacteria bacterium]
MRTRKATFETKADIKRNFRVCDAKGCKNEGLYKAPKDRDLKEYYHFCLDCVRKYNKDWNYFKDLSFEEIEKEQKEEIYGAKTKKFGVKNMDDIINNSDDVLNIFKRFKSSAGKTDRIKAEIKKSAKENRALKLFGLNFPFSASDLKKSYKDLVKKHHPDKHQGSKDKESQFKKIVEYKDVLDKLLKKIESC